MKSKREWVPNRPVADSALAVEAALPELERESRRWYDVVLRVMGGLAAPSGSGGTLATKQTTGGPSHVQYGGGAMGIAGDFARGMHADRIAPLSLAASELAEQLSADERKQLRESGELPEWFLPKVRGLAAVIRKDLRRRR